MILGFLWGVLKGLLILGSIVIVLDIIVYFVTIPFKRKKEEQLRKEFTDSLLELFKEELAKDTKKTTNTKKKEK